MQSVTPFSSLRDEQERMTSLLALMKQEQLHLVAAEIDAITEITARKTVLVGQLSQLAQAGNPEAAALWAELLGTTREAKEQNRLNSLLVNKHMLHTQGALNAV